MTSATLRRLADAVAWLLPFLYPKRRSDWAGAMRCEIEQVEDDGAALLFALGCLWGGCRVLAAETFTPSGKDMTMIRLDRLREPRAAGIACALAATGLGIFYLIAAGAPLRYPVVNAAAFLLGIVALGGLGAAKISRHAAPLLVVLATCLLATAFFGAAADGAVRWIRVGPLGVQVSLVLLPLMIVTFARSPGPVGCAAMAVAAAALALQPDRAMAGVLLLAMAALAAARPGRWPVAALAAAMAGFLVSLARPDPVPAVPFVDQILFTAFEVHLLAGAAVLLGSLLLLVPALLGWRADRDHGHAWLVFGAIWLGCIAAAVLGNYPTPVVGYGGSAILGYLLGFSALPARARSAGGNQAAARPEGQAPGLRRSAAPA